MKVLFGADGSEYALETARFLSRLDFTEKDEIKLLYVISEQPYEDDWDAARKVIENMKHDLAPRVLKETRRILGNLPCRISTRELEGYPDDLIVETAEEERADLIALGARGARGLELLLVGSTTRAVALKSPKPTLIVKPPHRKYNKTLRVLLATDGSSASRSVCDTLGRIPFPRGTELTIIEVTGSPYSDIPERYAPTIEERERAAEFEKDERRRKSEDVLIEACHRLEPRFGPTMRSIVRPGRPVEEILKLAEELDADLLAMGSRGLRGIKGMLGSVSRNLMHQSRRPVLIDKG